jgi:microcystin degradation protein MlrC
VPKILVAECKQEVASFNPVKSRYGDFVVRRGKELLQYHSAAREEVGGALGIFGDREHCTVVPTYSAKAVTSGGLLAANDFSRIAEEYLESLARAGQIDGAYFSLHGAMAAEGEEDPEGFLISESRKILGEEIPIVISLDLHAIVTDRMLRCSDAIVAYHTYPHVDFDQTGARAARLLLAIQSGQARPVTARVRIPMLVRGDELITKTGSFGQVIREAKRFERRRQGLSAGVIIGNPFTDVPDLRSNSFAVANSDPQLAADCAVGLARQMWARRHGMQAKLTSLPEAVSLAAETDGTAVLMDAADATSSGASGDGNSIIRAAQHAGFSGSVLAPVVDAPAVAKAFAAGVGGTVRTELGGSLDPLRFQPLTVEGRVKLLSDGRFRSESFHSECHAGPTAVLESGRRVFVVTSRAVNLYDRALFLAHGQDPRSFDLVVVKSPHCEPHMYQRWCSLSVSVDAPGATSANLLSLGHAKCPRPIFPLDEMPDEVPLQVEIYRRDRTGREHPQAGVLR